MVSHLLCRFLVSTFCSLFRLYAGLFISSRFDILIICHQASAYQVNVRNTFSSFAVNSLGDMVFPGQTALVMLNLVVDQLAKIFVSISRYMPYIPCSWRHLSAA